MEQTLTQFIAANTSLVEGTDLFIDETAAEEKNCVLIKAFNAVSSYTGIEVFDITIIICDLVYDTARSLAETIKTLFDGKRGIGESSWGTIGNIVSRYDGTDTLKRTIYSVAFKIGKQED